MLYVYNMKQTQNLENMTKEETLQVQFFPHHIEQINEFMGSDIVSDDKKQELAEAISFLSSITERYEIDIKNIRNGVSILDESKGQRETRDSSVYVDMNQKLKLIELITKF